MARCFRSLSCKENAPPIFFLNPTIYEIESAGEGSFNGVNYIYAEPMVDLKDWER